MPVSRLLAFASLFLSSLVSDAVPMPQSNFSMQRHQNVTRIAVAASSAAQAELLQVLDSPDFRAELAACCPGLVDYDAPRLLQRLREEREVAEIASGFPAVSGRGEMSCFSVELGFGGFGVLVGASAKLLLLCMNGRTL